MMTLRREPEFTDVADMIVGVGASAGGLEAFKCLLGALSPATGLAFILVQHFDPERESLLAEILAANTSLSVVEVHDGQPLLADTVYVARPGTVCEIADGWRLGVRSIVQLDDRLRPIDHLFESLATHCEANAVGILLSGAGHDGTAGLRALHGRGALTLVQSPATASHPSMPSSAIEAGVVDRVLPIEAMPAALEQIRFERETLLARQAHRRAARQAQRFATLEALTDLQLERLDQMLTPHLDAAVDVGVVDMAPTMLARRVRRRMELLGIDAVDDYLDPGRSTLREAQALATELRGGMTCFFRDPEVFDALTRQVIEPMVAEASVSDGLRIWVPGCATGEEALSLLMVIVEACDARPTPIPLQVFATDVDRQALAEARRGRFPASIGNRVSQARLERFFVPIDDARGGGYQVSRRLRDVISFAAHDLQRDAPFSRMDLVSCRNVLRLFSTSARERVVRMLHFALRPGGVLLLGASERLPPLEGAFETLDEDARLFRRRDDTSQLDSAAFWASRHPRHRRRFSPDRTPARPRHDEGRAASLDGARRAILSLVPAALVVDDHDDILYTCGDLNAFVRFPSGEPRLGLFTVLHEALSVRVRAAVNRCRKEQAPVVTEVLTETDAPTPVRIEVHPAPNLDEGAVVIGLFSADEATKSGASRARPSPPGDDARVTHLEAELSATRNDLAKTLDELGRFNEELRASNEAAIAMNEELQASNEELEATTEELTSVNDELEAVNTTLNEKVHQLEQAHDDLRNFFASTRLATLFLDDSGHVRRASPAAAELLGLEPGDIGRPLAQLAIRVPLLGQDLDAVARRVLDDLIPHDDEIESVPGHWIARRVLPYRTASRRIAGVVVNFVEISELKQAAGRLDLRARQQAVVARLGMRALRDPDMTVFSDRVVRAVQQALSSDTCELLELMSDRRRLQLRTAVSRRDTDAGPTDVPLNGSYLPVSTNQLASAALDTDEAVYMTDLRDERAINGAAEVAAAVACVVRDGEVPYGVLCVYSHRPGVLTEDDGDFVRAVANVLGTFVTRVRTSQRLAIERGVAQVLASAADFESAIDWILRIIADELGSTVAELWQPDDERLGELACSRVLTPRMPRRASALRARLADHHMRPGQGLVGRAWESGEPLWLTDTDTDDASQFARLTQLRAEGLHMGFAVPIVGAGDETFAVMCFFSPSTPMVPDIAFMHTLQAIGRAIGEFVLRTRAQQRLAEQSAELETVYASLPVGVLVLDRQGRILKINPRMSAIDPGDTTDYLGRPVSEIWPELAERVASLTERITRTQQPVRHIELELGAGRGGSCFWSCSFAPIVEPTLGVVAISCVVEDITERKRYEGALREAARQKDQFLAMLGHELRNPLAAIRSSAELLARRHPDNPGLQRTQAVLNRQSAHMARLVDGLLDVSRIASGKLQLEREILDLREVLGEMLDEFCERLEGREIECHTHIAEHPLWVEGDRVRLVQVLDNLLGNALKFTAPPGVIEVRAEVGDGDRVRVSVRDTGAGIPPEILPLLFEPFQQAPQDLARSSGGLGLGLSLVKGIVEQHDGHIEARSEGLGKGAEFVIELPLAEAPRQLETDTHDTSSALRILIVEDHHDAAEILRDLLELEGHEVALVDRGDRALDAIREHTPDVVLCDLGLPGMSGYEVARAVRADDRLAATPMVALTGYGQKEDRTRSRDAGFDEHLTKPIDLDTLGQVVSRVVGRSAAVQ